jgi:RNA polymerase sigma-70 factor (ECF subfamily)
MNKTRNNLNINNTSSDDEILKLLKNDDISENVAFIHFWNKYEKLILSYSLKLCRSKYDYEDIFQNTWLKFFEALRAKKEIKSPKAYLHKIAFNCFLRKNDLLLNADDFEFNPDLIPSILFCPERETINREELNHIIKFTNSLPPESSELFRLRAIQGLQFREISEIMGIKYDAVRLRYFRIKKQISPYAFF